MSADDSDSFSSETSGWSKDDDLAIEDTHAPPRSYWIMAGIILLIAVVVVPLVEDTAIGASAAMFFSLVMFFIVIIEFGIPSGTLVQGLIGAAVLALIGGLIVSVASLAITVSGPAETALFWMAVCVGAAVGFLGRIGMVAEHPSTEDTS
jgi:hypothetical protein